MESRVISRAFQGLNGQLVHIVKTDFTKVCSDLFTKIFPAGNAESFCDHIFRMFDSDGNNFLDFKEFLMALDIAQCTDERQRLEWSFRLVIETTG